MQLTEIRIKNYRLLIDAILDVDTKTTLILCESLSRPSLRMWVARTVCNFRSMRLYTLDKGLEIC